MIIKLTRSWDSSTSTTFESWNIWYVFKRRGLCFVDWPFHEVFWGWKLSCNPRAVIINIFLEIIFYPIFAATGRRQIDPAGVDTPFLSTQQMYKFTHEQRWISDQIMFMFFFIKHDSGFDGHQTGLRWRRMRCMHGDDFALRSASKTDTVSLFS